MGDLIVPTSLSLRRTSLGGAPMAAPRTDRSLGATAIKSEALDIMLPSNMVERGLFSLAYLTTHGTTYNIPPYRVWILTILDDFQLLAFPLTPIIFLNLPAIVPMIVQPAFFLTDYSLYVIVNAVALGQMAVTALVSIVVGTLIRRQANTPPALLAFLRNLYNFLNSVFMLPSLFLLFGAIRCDPNTGMLAVFPAVKCSSQDHVPTLVMSILGLFLVVPMQIVSSTLLIDTFPTSTSPTASAHVGVIRRATNYRIYLVAMHTFASSMPTAPAPQWLYSLLMVILLTHLAIEYITVRPYFNPWMNRYKAGMTTAAAAAAFSVLVSFVSTTAPEQRTAWLRAMIAAAAAFPVGAVATYVAARRTVRMTVRDWRNVALDDRADAAETHAAPRPRRAAILASIMGGDPTFRGAFDLGIGYGAAAAGAIASPPRRQSPPPVMLISSGMATSSNKQTKPSVSSPLRTATAAIFTVSPPTLNFGSGDGGSNTRHSGSSPSVAAGIEPRPLPRLSIEGIDADEVAASESNISVPFPRPLQSNPGGGNDGENNALNALMLGKSMDVLAAVRERSFERKNVFASPHQLEQCLRMVRDADEPTLKQLTLGLQLMDRALAEFPTDSVVLLATATYLAAYYGDRGVQAARQLLHDLQTSMRSGTIDVRYMAYVRDRVTREMGESALDRALVESLNANATRLHLHSLHALRLVWHAIHSSAPVDLLELLIGKMAIAQEMAASGYRKLVAKSPRDQRVLRSFAQFLVCVEGNVNQANQLLALADEIEARDTVAPTALKSGGNSQSSDLSSSAAPFPGASQEVLSSRPVPRFAQLAPPSGAATPILRSTQLHSGGGYASSQASGSSTSGKQRLFIRRVVVQKINHPLAVRNYLLFGCLVLIVALCLGFYGCSLFFDNSVVSRGQLFTSITVRQTALHTIEDLRLMALSVNDPLGSINYRDVVADLLVDVTGLANSVSDITAWSVTANQSWDHYRMYQPVVTPNKNDFKAMLVSPLDAAQLVVSAGKLALKYNGKTVANTLTSAAFMANMEFRLITDNFVGLQTAVSGMLSAYMANFMTFFYSNFDIMGGLIAAEVVAFGLTAFLVGYFIIRRFFANEQEVIQVLRRMPRKISHSLVNQVTEDLDNFREIAGVAAVETDGGGEDAHVELARAMSETGSQSTWGVFNHTSTRYYAVLVAAAVAIAAVIAVMFTSVIVMSRVTDFSRISYVSNRMYANTQFRICIREYFYSDGTFGNDWLVRTCRSSYYDMVKYHALSTDFSMRMAIDFPDKTVEARVCANGAACGITEDTSIGFTARAAQQSLDAAFSRLLGVGEVVLSGMAQSVNPTNPSTLVHRHFRLAVALSVDAETRMTDLVADMSADLDDDLVQALRRCVGSFISSLILMAASLLALYRYGIQRLLVTGRSLASLVVLIPHHQYGAQPDLVAYLSASGVQVEPDTAAAAAATAAARAEKAEKEAAAERRYFQDQQQPAGQHGRKGVSPIPSPRTSRAPSVVGSVASGISHRSAMSKAGGGAGSGSGSEAKAATAAAARRMLGPGNHSESASVADDINGTWSPSSRSRTGSKTVMVTTASMLVKRAEIANIDGGMVGVSVVDGPLLE
ncbi:hypothetical protein BC828DRAFT_373663 [Blastocladiella britannica]|nr:hypothetical protein BC828DRAFT_373663 [Blastocladiella britannica]